MSLLKHNKKRNTGLISEFFARYMAKAIIERRDGDLTKAREIFRKHFHKGTDLHRELKLFEALYDTKVANKETAHSMIQQVKEACKLQSQQKIDLEKTALLHEVNATLNDAEFFNKEVDDFKTYATVQVLLNHWRGKVVSENISEAAQLEDRLIQHLTRRESVTENKKYLSMTNEDIDVLVLNIMTEKLNSKYNSLLTEDQKKILRLFVFSKDNVSAREELSQILEGIRFSTIQLADRAAKDTSSDNELDVVTSKKLNEVKTLLLTEYKDTKNVTDEMVTFYLSVSKLEKELRDE